MPFGSFSFRFDRAEWEHSGLVEPLRMLDEVPLHSRQQIIPEGTDIRAWGRQRGVPDAPTAFEHVALKHMQSLMPSIRDLQLCPPGTQSLDIWTPDTSLLVGQVKSHRNVSKTVLDQTVGAALRSGPHATRMHVFFYSEAGYPEDAYAFADERGLFLWHLDFHGSVLPWSAASRWLLTRANELAASEPSGVEEILNWAAWHRYEDRSGARRTVIAAMAQEWTNTFGPSPDLEENLKFTAYALSLAEGLQQAEDTARTMLQEFRTVAASHAQHLAAEGEWAQGLASPAVCPEWKSISFEHRGMLSQDRLYWIGHGGGAITEATFNDFPERLSDQAFTWINNHWDGDYEFFQERYGEISRMRTRRRDLAKQSLEELISALDSGDRARLANQVRAARALTKTKGKCPKCLTDVDLLEIPLLYDAPRTLTPEKVWSALLRGTPEPRQAFAGFTRRPDNLDLWWELEDALE